MDSIVMLEGPDQRAAEVDAFRAEFLRYAAMPDLTVPCPVGKLRCDFSGNKFRQTVWQVIADAMDDKPEFTRRAVAIICNLALGMHQEYAAKDLLEDMAEHWAELRCDL